MANRKRQSRELYKSMAIITASNAVSLFFSQLRKDCRYSNLSVSSADTNDYSALIKYVKGQKRVNKFDQIYVVFGLDEVNVSIEELQAELDLYKDTNIKICYLAPSFDLWIYLHMFRPSVYIANKESVISSIEKKIPGYEMTTDFMVGPGAKLFMQLFTYNASADMAARDYNILCVKEKGFKSNRMPELNKALMDICGKADMSHNTRML